MRPPPERGRASRFHSHRSQLRGEYSLRRSIGLRQGRNLCVDSTRHMAAQGALTRQSLFEIARTLPAAPKVLAGLGELLKDVNAGLDEVADLIKVDAALAARIIRISNSVVYGGGGGAQHIGAIEDAVNRVGFSEVHRLVGVVASDRLAERALIYYGVETDPLREHMLFTALACEALAEQCGLDARSAYTAGLLRTIGMLVLDRVAERLPDVTPYEHARYGGYPVWEGIAFGLSNTEVGALILHDWHFPADIVGALREHYLLHEADYENRFACLLNVAGRVAAEAGHLLPGDRRYCELAPRQVEVVGLTEDQMREAGWRARAVFARLCAELH
jgi:HD-like signal output (HDOD) protein